MGAGRTRLVAFSLSLSCSLLAVIKPYSYGARRSFIFLLGRIFRVIGSNDEIKRRRNSSDDLSPVKLTDLARLLSLSLPLSTLLSPIVRLSRSFDRRRIVSLCSREEPTSVVYYLRFVVVVVVARVAWSDLFFLDLVGAEIGLSPDKV